MPGLVNSSMVKEGKDGTAKLNGMMRKKMGEFYHDVLWRTTGQLIEVRSTRPPLSSDIIIFTDRPELKAKGERIIFEDREVKKRKFSLRETALFNPDPILAKISRILTEN